MFSVPIIYVVMWFCIFGGGSIKMHRRAELVHDAGRVLYGSSDAFLNEDNRRWGSGNCYDVPAELPCPATKIIVKMIGTQKIRFNPILLNASFDHYEGKRVGTGLYVEANTLPGSVGMAEGNDVPVASQTVPQVLGGCPVYTNANYKTDPALTPVCIFDTTGKAKGPKGFKGDQYWFDLMGQYHKFGPLLCY